MHTAKVPSRRLRAGFTLVEIMIVVAIIGLLAAIAIPNLRKASDTAQRTTCIQNLQAINGAKEQWSLENRKGAGTTIPESEINDYLAHGAPECPASGEYRYNTLGTPPTCSIPGHTLSRKQSQP